MIGFITIVLIVTLLLFGFLWSVAQFNEFSKTGIKFVRPVPFFGNLFKATFGVEHLATALKRVYDSFPNERYVGIFEFFSPTIVIRDPELIKMVTIKDFDHFHDIPFQIDEEIDPVFGRVLLSLKGNKWRQMRTTISPAFTSSKMKNMFHFITECADKFTSHYESECSQSNSGIDLDVRDLTTRFTSDVIASTAFSLEVDSLRDRDNYFYKQASLLTEQSLSVILKFTGFRVFPKLMKALGIPLFPESSTSYLKGLVSDTMNKREISGEYRPDVVHLLNEAKKGTLKHDDSKEYQNKEFASTEEYSVGKSNIKWADDDLIAQAVVFILAGFGTSSTLLCFLLYELAINTHVQEKLCTEIDEISSKNGGKVTYHDLLHMNYMDMVISEALRKWPPIPFVNRLCTQEYDLGPVSKNSTSSFKIKKDSGIWIPINSIHMNPEYWPNPTKFDPERFSEENKRNIKSQTFLPFGSGPRNCIGARFALMEIKALIFHFLAKFEFNPCVKTHIPIRISTTTLFLESKDGYWLNMKLRNTT
ncbi:cytochrome P450 9e2-like [Arctopsyche grandis]|uniref:cytochrome P450 9e2-like n=1 Tax=Arctopsyche grandis TaxID=121162 RepID=UPI00406D6AB9